MGISTRAKFTGVHNDIGGRGANDAHPTSSITGLDASLAGKSMYLNGSDTFASGAATYTVTNAFITAATLVTVNPTGAKLGSWGVTSAAGSFTITSTATETSNVDFDWGALK